MRRALAVVKWFWNYGLLLLMLKSFRSCGTPNIIDTHLCRDVQQWNERVAAD